MDLDFEWRLVCAVENVLAERPELRPILERVMADDPEIQAILQSREW